VDELFRFNVIPIRRACSARCRSSAPRITGAARAIAGDHRGKVASLKEARGLRFDGRCSWIPISRREFPSRVSKRRRLATSRLPYAPRRPPRHERPGATKVSMDLKKHLRPRRLVRRKAGVYA